MMPVRLIALAAFAVLITGCVSVPFVRMAPDYTTVPESALRAAAAEVEAAVARGDRDAALSQHEGVNLSSPEVVQAIRSRAARIELVHAMLEAGFAYEEAGGLIAIKRGSDYKKATDSRERDRNALVVQSENESRWALYEGIIEASNWPPKSLAAVQHIFAQERIPHLPPGASFEKAE